MVSALAASRGCSSGSLVDSVSGGWLLESVVVVVVGAGVWLSLSSSAEVSSPERRLAMETWPVRLAMSKGVPVWPMVSLLIPWPSRKVTASMWPPNTAPWRADSFSVSSALSSAPSLRSILIIRILPLKAAGFIIISRQFSAVVLLL